MCSFIFNPIGKNEDGKYHGTMGYPLVNIQKTKENHHYSEFSHEK
jgi:hypothetical protein